MQIRKANICEMLEQTYAKNNIPAKDINYNYLDGMKRYSLYNNYILMKGIISKVSVNTLPIYKRIQQYPELNQDKHRFVIWIQRLNLLESELTYRHYDKFLKEIRGNSARALTSYKDAIISQTFRMNQKSSELVQRAESKYKGIPVIDITKWDYNRAFLLYNIATYKLYLLLCLQCDEIKIFNVITELNKLSEGVRDLYRNKYIVWKDDKVEYKIAEHMFYEPRINVELDREDYIRPIEFLFSTGYYNSSNINNHLLMCLYKLDALYLVENMEDLNERLNILLEE